MSGVTLTLAGKVALITGGSRGIGAATVRIFRQAGARVAFSYHSAKVAANALSDELGGPESCLPIQQDLTSPEQGRALVEATVRAFGRIDILVANHGVWPPEDVSIGAMSESQWRHTLGINLDSVFGLTQAAVAWMQRQGRPQPEAAAGHIVFISSTAGQRGEAFHADYAASKGALISLTKGLSTELAPDGIYVNCVAPGWVETDMSLPALNDAPTAAKIFATIPIRRVARPTEVAAPVLFLCTPYAGFITGEVVNVNGGAVLAG